MGLRTHEIGDGAISNVRTDRNGDFRASQGLKRIRVGCGEGLDPKALLTVLKGLCDHQLHLGISGALFAIELALRMPEHVDHLAVQLEHQATPRTGRFFASIEPCSLTTP